MTEGMGFDPFTADALRRGAKSASAFRTISEVAGDLNVPQHVLRFWETRFSQIRPLKRAGGRRYYRPEDVDLLRRIRDLLYRHGYTIRGAQRLLREASRGGGDMRAEFRAPPAAAILADAQRAGTPSSGEGFAPTIAPEGAEAAAQSQAAAAPDPAPVVTGKAPDHIAEVIVELTALRDLLRGRRRR